MEPTETHYYQLDLIQGDLCLELESDDREFIAQNMQRWYELFGYGTVSIQRPVTSMVSMSGPVSAMASGSGHSVDLPFDGSPSSEVPDPVNRMLMEQITQLQQQVQLLTQQQQLQVPSGTVQTQAASITSYSSIASISSISSTVKPPPEASVDVFVGPAHEEMQGDFDSFLSAKPEPEVVEPAFEQPVENLTITVENEVTFAPEILPETHQPQDSSENLINFRQPVENMSTVVESLQIEHAAETGIEPLPEQSVEEDLDLILDSLASDLEAAPPEDNVLQTIEPSPERVNEPSDDSDAPAEDILGALAQDLSEPVAEAPASLPQSPVENQVEALPDLSEFMPPGASADPWQNDDKAFDDALASAFNQEDLLTGSETPGQGEANPPASRPEVNYDFGIPLPDPPTDPAVQNLSLEVLENQETQTFESPFPKLSEDGQELIAPEPIQRQADPVPEVVPENFAVPQADPQKIASLNSLQVETMADLYDMAPGAAPGLDYLVLSAYFLSSFKQMERYALKNLNSQLLVAGLTPVNHGTVETAVAKEFIELIPDTTGTAPAAEYALTETGVNYACSLIKMS